MTILTIDGKVPWSAMIYWDEGRCGYVGIASASPTVEDAHADARQWHQDNPPRVADMYLKPTCRISVGYRNILDGSIG